MARRVPRSPEETEGLRRSVALLAPGHPGAMAREDALAVLGELQRVQSELARLRRGLRRLLDERDGEGP